VLTISCTFDGHLDKKPNDQYELSVDGISCQPDLLETALIASIVSHIRDLKHLVSLSVLSYSYNI
jgi:hypothetical protein